MQEFQELFKTLFEQYPWLVGIGPVVGVLLALVKRAGKLSGFGLLLVASLISGSVIWAYGLAEIWTPAEWRRVPFAIFLSVATSNLIGSTAETFMERISGFLASHSLDEDP